MTATTLIILILAYGVGGAVCLLVGLVIGAAARRPEERHQMDDVQPLVRTHVYTRNNDMEI